MILSKETSLDIEDKNGARVGCLKIVNNLLVFEGSTEVAAQVLTVELTEKLQVDDAAEYCIGKERIIFLKNEQKMSEYKDIHFIPTTASFKIGTTCHIPSMLPNVRHLLVDSQNLDFCRLTNSSEHFFILVIYNFFFKRRNEVL